MKARFSLLLLALFLFTFGCSSSQQGGTPGIAPTPPLPDSNQAEEEKKLKVQEEKYEQELNELKKQLAELEKKVKEGTATPEEKEFVNEVNQNPTGEEVKAEDKSKPADQTPTAKALEDGDKMAEDDKSATGDSAKAEAEKNQMKEENPDSDPPPILSGKKIEVLPKITKMGGGGKIKKIGEDSLKPFGTDPGQASSGNNTPTKHKDGEACGIDAQCENNFCVKKEEGKAGICQDPAVLVWLGQQLLGKKFGRFDTISNKAKKGLSLDPEKHKIDPSFGEVPPENSFKEFSNLYCPNGYVIANIWVNFGAVLNGIQPFCKRIDKLSDSKKRTLSPIQGSEEANKTKMINPPEAYAFYGARYQICTHNGNNALGHFIPLAKRVASWGVNDQVIWEGPRIGEGASNSGTGACQDWVLKECPENMLLTGIGGLTGKYVEALSFQCQKVISTEPEPSTMKLSVQPEDTVQLNLEGNCSNCDIGGGLFRLSCRAPGFDPGDFKSAFYTHPSGMVTGFHAVGSPNWGIHALKLICFSLNQEGFQEIPHFETRIAGDAHITPFPNSLPEENVCPYMMGAKKLISIFNAAIDRTVDLHMSCEGIMPSYNSVTTIDYESGAGGKTNQYHEVSCPQGFVMTAIQGRSGKQIDWIESIECTKVLNLK